MPRSYGTTNVMPYTSPPPVGLAGDEYYNPNTKQLFLSDGTSWNAIVGSGGGGGGSPAFTQTLLAPTVAGSPYAINHNLNFTTPLVQIYDAVTGTQVMAKVVTTSANQVTVAFSQQPPNNVTVVVSTGGMGPPGPSTAPIFTTTIAAPTVAGSPYSVIHNLGTITPLVQLWDAVTGSLVSAQVTAINTNTLGISFSTNPPNNVTVVVSSGGMGPPGPAGPGTQPTAAYVTTLTAPTTAGSPYTLTHNLATTAPLVHLWDAVTGLAIFAQLQVVSANQISVTFSANPPNNVIVVVSSGSMGQPGIQGPVGPAGPPAANTYNLVYYQSIPAPTVVSSPYTITHGLNSTYVLVQTWDSVTGQLVMMQTNIVDANNISLRTAQNIPNAINVVVTAGPASPAPLIPANYATKGYVDARTPNLPAPVTSGSGVQSFTDVLGDLWVAANGVASGVWKRAQFALRARVARGAAYTTAAGGGGVSIPFDTIDYDAYGLATSLNTTSFTWSTPVSGIYRLGVCLHLNGNSLRTYILAINPRGNYVLSDNTASGVNSAGGMIDLVMNAGEGLVPRYFTAAAMPAFVGTLADTYSTIHFVAPL